MRQGEVATCHVIVPARHVKGDYGVFSMIYGNSTHLARTARFIKRIANSGKPLLLPEQTVQAIEYVYNPIIAVDDEAIDNKELDRCRKINNNQMMLATALAARGMSFLEDLERTLGQEVGTRGEDLGLKILPIIGDNLFPNNFVLPDLSKKMFLQKEVVSSSMSVPSSWKNELKGAGLEVRDGFYLLPVQQTSGGFVATVGKFDYCYDKEYGLKRTENNS